MSAALPVFAADQVRLRLPMATCIDLLTDLHAAISRGEVELPLRTGVPLPFEPAGSNALLVMPGALTNPAVFGAKLLSIYPGNGQAVPPLRSSRVMFCSSMAPAVPRLPWWMPPA